MSLLREVLRENAVGIAQVLGFFNNNIVAFKECICFVTRKLEFKRVSVNIDRKDVYCLLVIFELVVVWLAELS